MSIRWNFMKEVSLLDAFRVWLSFMWRGLIMYAIVIVIAGGLGFICGMLGMSEIVAMVIGGIVGLMGGIMYLQYMLAVGEYKHFTFKMKK